MRIVMGVYACEPGRGSEPGVGWHWATQAAAHGHEVHAITRANNRDAIEAELSERPIQGLTFHYVDLPKPFLQTKRTMGYYGLLMYYWLWQIALARVARRLHREYVFDIAHHVTFVNDWMPSGLAWLGIPFIWGPVGGSTHVWPAHISARLPSYARRHEFLRKAIMWAARTVGPLRMITGRKASVILTYTREGLDGLRPRERSKARSIVHIGLDLGGIPAAKAGPPTDCFRVVTGGRLVHWKGFDLLIEGFARFRDSSRLPAEIVVTGTGPFKARLDQLVESLGVGDGVHFLGHLPTRDAVLELIGSCELYALPTLRDGPPVAILEAMAMGTAILCLDLGATHELVPEGTGIRVPAESREQVVQKIAAALEWAVLHRQELRRMGEAARAHVMHKHDWLRIGDECDLIYRSLKEVT